MQTRLSETEKKLASVENKLDKILAVLSDLDHNNREEKSTVESNPKRHVYNYFGDDDNS